MRRLDKIGEPDARVRRVDDIGCVQGLRAGDARRGQRKTQAGGRKKKRSAHAPLVTSDCHG